MTGTGCERRRGRKDVDEIDRQVGRRIRERRLLLGLTQQRLGEQVGIASQQAHKYEVGTNRISAGMLATIARALGVEPGDLYGGAEPSAIPDAVAGAAGRPLLELARDFARLDPARQAAVVALARALAGADEGDGRGETPLH